ncbi:MAG: DUF1513 domain-containing protein [Thiothrix litoralis]|uniref:DUF1513 domain-containing protein n=1 Tax=Thiothrix litoralis TaxID=2891210 RepID=UPI003C706218
MNRRAFLLLATAGTFGSALGVNTLMQQANATESRKGVLTMPATTLYSASDNPAGGHFLTRLDLANGQMQSRAVPMRGHAVLPLTHGRVLLFGRRPALECAVVDWQKEISGIPATAGRHFNGHGCLSAAGDVLFTSENAYDEKRGVLGIRDSKTFQHLGEYDTCGLDPHDVQLMPDGKTLVIANGGIEQHPDFGRRKLNLDTMQPSLVYIDAASGKKIDEYRLPDHHLSIRHLLVTATGDVGVALQYEGDLYKHQPQSLVAWQTHGKDLQLIGINTAAIQPFNGYMADLAYDPHQKILAVTSPRGNCITFWNIEKQTFLSASSLTEPSGIQFMPDTETFLVSSATGELHSVTASPTEVNAIKFQYIPDTLWDNHLVLT